MRLIAGFLVVCALLVGWLAWTVTSRSTSGGDESPAGSPALVWPPPETPPQAPASSPVLEQAPEAAVTPDTVETPSEAPASAPVNWAADGAASREDRRLAAALGALEADPFHEQALHDAAQLAESLEKWELAAELLGRLVTLRPADADRRFDHAAALMRIHHWIDAQAQLETVTELRPDDARAWFNRAICLQQTRNLIASLDAWDRAIGLSPDDTDAREHRAEVLLDLHRWQAAEDELARVAEARGDTQSFCLNRSLALLKLGQLDDAAKLVAIGLESKPRSVPLLNRAAEIAWARYELSPSVEIAQEVARLCTQSLENAPQQPDVRELLEKAQAASKP